MRNDLGTVRASFQPFLSDVPPDSVFKKSSFEKWWNLPVNNAGASVRFNRREIILHVADTDGGAHVDGALDTDWVAS